MKKILLTYTSILLLLVVAMTAVALFATPTASAATERQVIYAAVSNLKGNTYAQKSVVKLMLNDIIEERYFYIPESYFVEIEGKVSNTPYYSARYAGRRFLVKDDGEDVSPAVSMTFDDGEALSPDVTLALVEPVVLDGKTISTEGYTVKFLGYGEDDSIFVVASDEDTSYMGFISSNSVRPFSVPYQERAEKERQALIAEEQIPAPEAGDIKPNNSVALRIIIILGITIPAILIVLALFKPSKPVKRTGSRYTSDRDYDSPDNNNR